jgi:hypothetical protein
LPPPPPPVVPPEPPPPPKPAAPEAIAPVGPDPIAVALERHHPDAVEIVARKPIGKDLILLYTLDVIALGQSEGEDVCAAIEKRRQACVARCDGMCDQNESARCEAVDAYERLECELHEDAVAWEIARVHVERDVVKVRARRRLWGPDVDESGTEPKLRVYDVDGDRRSEITVVFPVSRFDEYAESGTDDGEIGVILDATDLHVQFAVTRSFATKFAGFGETEREAQTVWVAKDTDGDGHPHLTLTGKEMTKDNNVCDVDCPDDEEEALRPQRTRATQVCPYETAGDHWVCPAPQLGQELLDGSDGMQSIVGLPTE